MNMSLVIVTMRLFVAWFDSWADCHSVTYQQCPSPHPHHPNRHQYSRADPA